MQLGGLFAGPGSTVFRRWLSSETITAEVGSDSKLLTEMPTGGLKGLNLSQKLAIIGTILQIFFSAKEHIENKELIKKIREEMKKLNDETEKIEQEFRLLRASIDSLDAMSL